MMTIDWEGIIKYAIGAVLAASITGGGALLDRFNIEDSYQSKVSALAEIVRLHANECKD